MKKIIKSFVVLLTAIFTMAALVGCRPTTQKEKPLFDKMPVGHDHYFTEMVNLQTAGLQNFNPETQTNFVGDKIGVLKLKSATDGDTADFHLDPTNKPSGGDIPEAAIKGGTVKSYISVRFLGIDTPESTSAIQPWGKTASIYAKAVLESATAIVVDARATGDEYAAGGRLDSNGTRWLGFIWYTKDEDKTDLTKYRLFQLEMIEECFTNATGGDSFKDDAITLLPTETPILYNRYADSYGTMTMSEVLFEAELRMQKSNLSSVQKRKFGDTENDPNYDYSTEPTSMTITDAIKNFTELERQAKFIEITGVITAFVTSNFYMEDKDGTPIYVYMGINGNSIEDQFPRGTTIKIRGRLAEYGGQKQLSGIEFKRTTFKKAPDAEKVALPEPIEITGEQTREALHNLIGKLVTYRGLDFTGTNTVKSGAYTVYTNTVVKGITGRFNTLTVRVNGPSTGYPHEEFKVSTKPGQEWITGIMGIYQEEDLKEPVTEPSYQMVAINREIIEKDGKYLTISLFSVFDEKSRNIE